MATRKVSKKGRVYFDHGTHIVFQDTGEVRQKGANGSNYGSSGGYRSNQQRESFKKSGFEVKSVEGGMVICWGWRKTRFGIQKLYARPYSKSKIAESEVGNRFVNLFVTLTSDAGVIKTSGLYNFQSGKLVIQELGLVGSKNGGGKTASGKLSKGFFGKIK